MRQSLASLLSISIDRIAIRSVSDGVSLQVELINFTDANTAANVRTALSSYSLPAYGPAVVTADGQQLTPVVGATTTGSSSSSFFFSAMPLYGWILCAAAIAIIFMILVALLAYCHNRRRGADLPPAPSQLPARSARQLPVRASRMVEAIELKDVPLMSDSAPEAAAMRYTAPNRPAPRRPESMALETVPTHAHALAPAPAPAPAPPVTLRASMPPQGPAPRRPVSIVDMEPEPEAAAVLLREPKGWSDADRGSWGGSSGGWGGQGQPSRMSVLVGFDESESNTDDMQVHSLPPPMHGVCPNVLSLHEPLRHSFLAKPYL